jgi:hypothetical protein
MLKTFGPALLLTYISPVEDFLDDRDQAYRRILYGDKPADLPVQRVRKIEMRS